MPVVRIGEIQEFAAGGLHVRGLATPGRGAVEVMVWRYRVDAGCLTPHVVRDHEAIVAVLSGCGALIEGERTLPFSAGDVLIVPAHMLSRVRAGSGRGPLDCLLAMPAATRHYTPTGDEMSLPWAR